MSGSHVPVPAPAQCLPHECLLNTWLPSATSLSSPSLRITSLTYIPRYLWGRNCANLAEATMSGDNCSHSFLPTANTIKTGWERAVNVGKELPDASCCYSPPLCYELDQLGLGQAEGPAEWQRDLFAPPAQTSTTWPSLIKTVCFQEAQVSAILLSKRQMGDNEVSFLPSLFHSFIHSTNIDWTPTVSHWLCQMLKRHGLVPQRTLGLPKETNKEIDNNDTVRWELECWKAPAVRTHGSQCRTR